MSWEQSMRALTEVETEDRALRALTSRLAAHYADQYPAAHVAREALDGSQRTAS